MMTSKVGQVEEATWWLLGGAGVPWAVETFTATLKVLHSHTTNLMVMKGDFVSPEPSRTGDSFLEKVTSEIVSQKYGSRERACGWHKYR